MILTCYNRKILISRVLGSVKIKVGVRVLEAVHGPNMGQFLSNLFPPPPKKLRFKEVISRGEYREVWRGTLRKKPVAVKWFSDLLLSNIIIERRNERKMEAAATAFRSEYEVLKRAKNPYIVEYLGVYSGLGREGGALLVMEWMYQTLKTFLNANKGNLPRQKKMDICYQVGLFVFIHGQLSCSN